MNQLRKFADLGVWTPSQAIAGSLAALPVLVLALTGVMSASGAISGLAGGFVVMHWPCMAGRSCADLWHSA